MLLLLDFEIGRIRVLTGFLAIEIYFRKKQLLEIDIIK